MHNHLRARLRVVSSLLLFLHAAPPLAHAMDKQQRKAKEAEAKRLLNLGKTAEKQGRLLEAREQYLASEHVLYTPDAENALERIADQADQQVKSLVADAGKAYTAERFQQAEQLLVKAGTLHPGNLAIDCNLGLTRYQLGDRGEALTLLDECVGAMREIDARRRLAELVTALDTGDRRSVAPPAVRPQVVRLNDAILKDRDGDRRAGDGDDPVPSGSPAGLCAQVTQLQNALPGNPALVFDLATCAESEGHFDAAVRFLMAYTLAAPAAADLDAVQARLVVLNSLVAIQAPSGDAVRALYTSAVRHIDAHEYDRAIADYQKADEAAPGFLESKRRVATLFEAQGDVERARTYWRQVVLADPSDGSRQQTQLLVDGLDMEKGQYDELVSGARLILRDLLGRALLDGEPVGRIYAAYRLHLANDQIQSANLLLPLAPEVNVLQAFTSSQLNDFRSVRASLDALGAQSLPVSFYGAVFYKSVDPKKRRDKDRVYGKFEFEKGTVRFAEISTVKPKKRAATVASPAAGEDRLGGFGTTDGLRSGAFQGFTVPASAVKHFETDNGILVIEIDDKRIKHRKLAIEPLSFVLEIPPEGPGARRYMNNYIGIAGTYGAVQKIKTGKESTTTGEKLKMVYNVMSIGLSVTSVMFGDFTSILDVALGVRTLGHRIALSQRQVRQLMNERENVLRGAAFKAIPTEPQSLAFRADLK